MNRFLLICASENRFKLELNPSNPLSHNGNVAKAYATLVHDMYSDSTGYAFAPRAFKNVIGKYGPSFSGYGQQDSQEFLLFLLDGLQEDLNRIRSKPYIEKPDSTDEMVNNPVALRELADKCWDIYKARNDSVITDLFAGMYKSTVVCPICDKVSIIFDPFNNLTLQLPIENFWSRTICFFPAKSKPVRISVDIDKNASFMDLKEYVAKKVGTDAKRTIVVEIYRFRFYKVFKDSDTIAEERIQDNDDIAIVELDEQPTNWPRPNKPDQKRTSLYLHNNVSDEDLPEGDSPQADRMLVTVFNRQGKPGATRSQHQRALFGVPLLIIVTRDEARDYDAILRKVLAKVAILTTRNFLLEDADSDHSPEDSDTVVMNTEEGDSSSDSKVQAQSLDGEDGMVDISMRDTSDKSQIASPTSKPHRNHHAKSLPSILQPGSFIPPQVRNLFEMKYLTSGKTIPTSFNVTHDEGREYPTLASRLPEAEAVAPVRKSTKLQRRLQRLSSASSSDEDLDIDDVPEPVNHSFQVANAGSDSDDDLPPVIPLTQPHQTSSRFNKSMARKRGLITYTRKGRTAPHTPRRDQISHGGQSDALIKLGEQIFLDWSNEGYDALFGGDEDSEMRGAPTWDTHEIRPDPELEGKRRARAQRKKNGISLDDCLDEFGKAETLSENDAWYCPRCKEHRRATKQFELWKAPDILVIHLKRFSSQGRFVRDKLDVFVDFPVQDLDLTSRVVVQDDGRSLVYDLFAVDNHYGGLGGGHYTAFAKNFFDNSWYEYNGKSLRFHWRLLPMLKFLRLFCFPS